MRTTQYLLSTLKESPVDADIASHKIMIRAGIIRKLTSGIYTWLPTGYRVLQKIKTIIRDEMNNAGAIEISMPLIQPKDLWKNSGRCKDYGLELLQFTDRRNRLFILSPTHEEMITSLICNEINSYKQLPLNLFQIQTKFRDELRPRFGVLRSREFLMKDAYSFHSSLESMNITYKKMHKAYCSIFTRMGLEFRVVQANSGSMGGVISHEFQVLACKGEDNIVFSNKSNYAANIELAEAVFSKKSLLCPTKTMRLLESLDSNNTNELSVQCKLPADNTVKIVIVHACKEARYPLVALMLRSDHELNNTKAEKLPQVLVPLTFASQAEINLTINVSKSYLGPINLPMPIIIDRSVSVMSDFYAGANCNGKYYAGINWIRDLPIPEIADLRNVVEGDDSPDKQGKLLISRSIEVGHTFQLGTKYSESMKAIIQDIDGRKKPLLMGCYGIGITRLVAAIIEQNHDERGIIWPESIAPFDVAILPININKSFRVKKISEKIYEELLAQNIDVLLDDRKESLGVMFSDIELIGVPHIIIIGDRDLDTKEVQYKNRRTRKKQIIKINSVVDFLSKVTTI